MALPKITHPVYKIKIPSTKKVVSFRPYTVKEEKLLLMIKSSEEISDAVDVLKQVITNCAVEPIDVDKLALFDIEYIFVKMRSKSVGEEVELVYSKGESKAKFIVNLEEVEVKFNPDHETKFMLTESIGISMHYPSFDAMLKLDEKIEKNEEIDTFIFDLFIDCVDNIYDDKKVYTDFTRDEMSDYILDLPRDCVDKIKRFFDTMPVLEHKINIKFKDGVAEEVTLRGLKDFFIF